LNWFPGITEIHSLQPTLYGRNLTEMVHDTGEKITFEGRNLSSTDGYVCENPQNKTENCIRPKRKEWGEGRRIKRWNCGGCLLEHTFRPDGAFEVGHS
jgi:hypothetical protein